MHFNADRKIVAHSCAVAKFTMPTTNTGHWDCGLWKSCGKLDAVAVKLSCRADRPTKLSRRFWKIIGGFRQEGGGRAFSLTVSRRLPLASSGLDVPLSETGHRRLPAYRTGSATRLNYTGLLVPRGAQ